jgi:hypothetical protein
MNEKHGCVLCDYRVVCNEKKVRLSGEKELQALTQS